MMRLLGNATRVLVRSDMSCALTWPSFAATNGDLTMCFSLVCYSRCVFAGLDTSVVDGPYIYVAAEIADWINASDFGRTRLPLECSHGKTIGAKSAPTSRLADVACSGQVVTKGTYATWPKSSKRSTDIVLAQILATNGEVQQLRRTGQVDKSGIVLCHVRDLPTVVPCATALLKTDNRVCAQKRFRPSQGTP